MHGWRSPLVPRCLSRHCGSGGSSASRIYVFLSRIARVRGALQMWCRTQVGVAPRSLEVSAAEVSAAEASAKTAGDLSCHKTCPQKFFSEVYKTSPQKSQKSSLETRPFLRYSLPRLGVSALCFLHVWLFGKRELASDAWLFAPLPRALARRAFRARPLAARRCRPFRFLSCSGAAPKFPPSLALLPSWFCCWLSCLGDRQQWSRLPLVV